MSIYRVYHDDGSLAAELHPDDMKNVCLGHKRITTTDRTTIGGETGDLCGGCDACQLMQAQYAGMKVVEHDDGMKVVYYDRA